METLKLNKPLEYMAKLCRARSTNGGESNYHIFLNSVKGITKIIQLANLSPSEVRVVCSNGEGTARRNKLILPAGFTIASTTDPVKPINFYTSTCFEGQDIYDKNGRTFIVSDSIANYTKIDISTSLIQICGRIRDSQYKNQVTQIYASSHYKNVSLAEFEDTIHRNIKEAEQNAAALDGLSERMKSKWVEKAVERNEPYITVEDGHITVDRNVANLEIVNYKIVNGIYTTLTNMVKALKRSGFVVDSATEIDCSEESVPAPNQKKVTFKEAFEEYCQILETKTMFNFAAMNRQERIECDKPLVREAYEKLGIAIVRELNYHVSNIRRAITAMERANEDVKITKMVNASLPRQHPIPSAKVKTVLQEIYNTLGIPCIAKAKDLDKWYEIKVTTTRIDGKPTNCVTIIHPYINFGI